MGTGNNGNGRAFTSITGREAGYTGGKVTKEKFSRRRKMKAAGRPYRKKGVGWLPNEEDRKLFKDLGID